ncbi:MAG: hypothetical protein KDF58_02285 [Alphaproteobacteria bacterium]|nr:hypothetical protein [Alphaproteobacteria bacterium]HPF46422.1 hypothetical protein [Emcibacteraceae bacterium]HRW28922.1 hypothetical protein [Emcibacteraceae bacterium]
MADEEVQQNSEQEKPKSGSKKLLIIGLLAGLIVGGGGAAGFFIMQPHEAAKDVHEENIVEEKEPDLPDYQYAKMDRLQLPLFYDGKILNYALMDVSIEVIGNKDKMLVVKNILIIRDALLRFYSVNSVGRDDNPRIVDFDKLSEKIKGLVDDELNKEIVSRVVITQSRNI